MSILINNSVLPVLGIIAAGFLSEDGATVTGAALAATKMLDARLAFLGVFAGLWIGDFGVYAAARTAGNLLQAHPRISSWLSRKLHLDSRHPVARQSVITLGISRFLPGTRVPAYIAAGLFAMPVVSFAATTALTAAIWTGAAFAAISLLPGKISLGTHGGLIAGLSGLGLYAIMSVWRIWGSAIRTRAAAGWKRLFRWEFWPSGIFYAPVGLMYAWHALRFRGISLPTVANPGQYNGGIVGESKIEILRELMKTSPEFTADAYLIAPTSVAERLDRFDALCAGYAIDFPLVLKPDTAQRGSGFRKIFSRADAADYFARVNGNIVLQRYVEGPEEAGVFYYRFPGEERGHIFAVTRKEFPAVIGDGTRTLKDLILADPRASLIAGTYFDRFPNAAHIVLREGERKRLVEAGNHCQGCIFRNGTDLSTDALRDAFDDISRALPGFFIGRFDVRYRNDEELRRGRGFQIVELNGAASEATHIYDQRNSLWFAYKSLYRQWELVFAIGAANRERGFCTVSLFRVWQDWKQFRKQAEFYPLAD
jgi:membrane protein DedA with SNARE-associated domain